MGVICHHGSVGMGHYTAYIRKGETWFLTDDCRVIEVSVQEVESCEAYVLFYQYDFTAFRVRNRFLFINELHILKKMGCGARGK